MKISNSQPCHVIGNSAQGTTRRTNHACLQVTLTNTVPLPDNALAAARAKGQERYDDFIDALARRMEKGPRLGAELSRDADGEEEGGE